MEIRRKERFICCMVAAILLFMGMCVETTTVKSSFSVVSVEGISTLQPVSYILEEVASCTLNMLNKSKDVMVRNHTANSVSRWNSKAAISILIVGGFLQYLFYYQSAEGREDGQLFLCRSVAVNYIHLKDSGE